MHVKNRELLFKVTTIRPTTSLNQSSANFEHPLLLTNYYNSREHNKNTVNLHEFPAERKSLQVIRSLRAVSLFDEFFIFSLNTKKKKKLSNRLREHYLCTMDR